MKVKSSVWFASYLTIAACSGGGGSSSSPPPPPPPPPPPAAAAPDISISVDKPSVDEGQSFTIDVRATTDPNGDTVTFSIEQSSGPSLDEIAGTPDGVFSFNTPRVDNDTQVSFTITASDGSLSSSQSINVTISNIVRTPLFAQWTDVLETQSVGVDINQLFSGFGNQDGALSVGNIVYALSENAQFGDDRIHELVFASDGTFSAGTGLQLPAFSGPDPDDLIYVFDDLNLDTRLDVVQYAPVEGLLAIYQNTEDFGSTLFSTIASINAPATGASPVACTVTTALVGNDRPGFGINEFPGLLFGTFGNGLRAVLNSGNPRTDPSQQTIGFSTEATLTISDTFCGFALGRLNSSGIDELYGYDPDRQEVVPISHPVTTSPTLGQAISISLPAANMDLVEMKSGIGQGGQSFLALLFSDGVHEGNHQITILQFENGSVSQSSITLPNGVPSELLVASIDALGQTGASDFDSDLLVVVPDTPYVYTFVNTSETSGPVTFSSIGFFEIGFDVNNVTLFDATQSFGPELITGASDGTITVYRNTEG